MVLNNRKVDVPKTASRKEKLFREALFSSYHFDTDELDCSKSLARKSTTKSFDEIFKICLERKNSHWTIYYRKSLYAFDFDHYEFSCSTMGLEVGLYIWIRVRPDLAENMIKKYKLIYKDY